MIARLPEDLWTKIEVVLPIPDRGVAAHLSDRRAIETVVFMLRTGLCFRDMGTSSAGVSYSTLWRRLRRWHALGVWSTIEDLLRTGLPDGSDLPWHRLNGSKPKPVRCRGAPGPASAAFRSRVASLI